MLFRSAGNSHVMQSDWVLIEKFHYGPMYFASWKGNSKITNQISEALVKINLYEPDLNERLIEKYFGNIAYSPYNKEEIDCINKKMTYPVYLDQDTRPVAWYDEASGAMSGIIVDICKDLEEKTGLYFNYQPYSKMNENTGNCCVSYRVVDPGDKNSGNEDNITDSIGEFRFSLYHKNGNSFDTIKPYSIACLKNRSGLVKYLKIKYPLCTITEYDTPEECLNLVHEGKEDLAFLNSSIADSLIITNSINDISTLPSTSKNFGIRLEFKGDDSALLVQIVNKGIRLTDGSVMSASMLKYATETKPKTDFLYYVKNNPILAVAILLCIIVVLVLICALLFYARIMKKDKMRAEAVSKERAAFFSRMSHDMRTPMNGILGLTSLSKDEYNSTVLRDNLQKIDESGQYLIGLINDTLDYQKIEAGRMELVYETVSADELIRTGTQMILRLAEEKGVSFRIVNKNADLSKCIRTDVIRIKQLFTNLLSNAVKFTPKGGSVEMIIEVVNRDDKGVKDRITVSDTGIGMSESFIKNGLFKPFIQEENKITSQYAGTGLGLSIAKQIADLMGASISVESHPGEGTKFTVYIAFETVEPVAVEKQTVEKSCSKADAYMILKGKRVLMAEDHPLNAEITEKLLERKDVSVIWAKDGRQCVDIFTGSKEGSFDAVLMDIRMPGMDGIEATEVIRALERTDAKTVPIIAMSANAYTEDVRKSLDAGMNAHLAKPVQPDRLYGTLVMFIQKSGSDK